MNPKAIKNKWLKSLYLFALFVGLFWLSHAFSGSTYSAVQTFSFLVLIATGFIIMITNAKLGADIRRLKSKDAIIPAGISLALIAFSFVWVAALYPAVMHHLLKTYGVHAVAKTVGPNNSYYAGGSKYSRGELNYNYTIFYDGYISKLTFKPAYSDSHYNEFMQIAGEHEGSIGVRYLPWWPSIVLTEAELK